MSFRLGLTGSVGMGKSTTARMFAEAGVPVWDADATVHGLYAPAKAGALAIAQLFPAVIGADGAVRRDRLRDLIVADRTVLDRVNAAVHPLVTADRAVFLTAHAAAPVVLLDIPLLYETGANRDCDAVVVVSAPAEVQRARVLERGMSVAELQMILSRQLPDTEKCARADYVILTTDLESAGSAVKDVLTDVRRRMAANA